MTAPDRFHTEEDPTGLQTLERFSEATHFNRWLFDTIAPYCKGHVLEVGSGIGNITKLFLERQLLLTASDLRQEYCTYISEQHGQSPYLAGIEMVDLAVPDLAARYPHLVQQFDTVVALNVVEHIADDKLAIQNCLRLLKPGGHLVILVPAYAFLFNQFDQELGHYRRYTRSSLRTLMEQSGVALLHEQYFNATGIIGWYINGRLLKKRLIPRKQLMLFDRLVPLIRLVDMVSFYSIGLSTIAVGQKPL